MYLMQCIFIIPLHLHLLVERPCVATGYIDDFFFYVKALFFSPILPSPN